MVRIDSGSAEETERIGAILGTLLGPGDFVALRGELGAGKTMFAKGVAKGMGVGGATPVVSPTYTLLNIHSGRIPLYHFDLYRLCGDDDVIELGFVDYFSGDGVSLVEWPERLSSELPEGRLEVSLSYLGDTGRRVEMQPISPRFEKIVTEFLRVYKKG